MMEYCDDVRHFEGHGHASCDAYTMATSLASDIVAHLKQVIFQKLPGNVIIISCSRLDMQR